MVNETDRRLLTSMYRFRRSCVRVRESTLLVALSRTGLARGRLLLDRHRRPTAKSNAHEAADSVRQGSTRLGGKVRLPQPSRIWTIKRRVEGV